MCSPEEKAKLARVAECMDNYMRDKYERVIVQLDAAYLEIQVLNAKVSRLRALHSANVADLLEAEAQHQQDLRDLNGAELRIIQLEAEVAWFRTDLDAGSDSESTAFFRGALGNDDVWFP